MPSGSAADRARRMLALVGMLQPGAGTPLATLAVSLGVSVEQIAADLELLSLCGIAPYYPDDLVPLYLDGETVRVFGAMPALDRTVRLSAREARALATALQATGRTADDPLVTRLLEAASESGPREIERVVRTLAGADPGVHTTLAVAIHRCEAVRIRYQRGGSDEVAERVVEPLALLNERGTWYVEAHCRAAGTIRTFRLDRIETASPTGERFERREASVRRTALPVADLPRALVRLDPGVEVPEREWPGVSVVEITGDGTLVEVPYAGTAWIARQIVSLLGSAEVLEPAEIRRAVALLAASARADADGETVGATS
ncbi:MAG TPA: WYL domain-containing protein [Coriobacteriia bacterium]|nr:WYL domain-containing protein [Coriobacteriia bacterium]